jgi:hypothetical protein
LTCQTSLHSHYVPRARPGSFSNPSNAPSTSSAEIAFADHLKYKLFKRNYLVRFQDGQSAVLKWRRATKMDTWTKFPKLVCSLNKQFEATRPKQNGETDKVVMTKLLKFFKSE